MGIACDFCGHEADRHGDVIFLAAPHSSAHICEECVSLAVAVIERRKREDLGTNPIINHIEGKSA